MTDNAEAEDVWPDDDFDPGPPPAVPLIADQYTVLALVEGLAAQVADVFIADTMTVPVAWAESLIRAVRGPEPDDGHLPQHVATRFAADALRHAPPPVIDGREPSDHGSLIEGPGPDGTYLWVDELADTAGTLADPGPEADR